MRLLPSSLLVALSAGVALAAQPSPSLKQAAGDKLLIGAAVSLRTLDDPALSKLVAEQYSSITAENDFKPANLHPRKGEFDFATADRYVAFAKKHDLKLIGHTLVWHAQAPKHLFEDAAGKPLPREEALENLRVHVTTIVTHFKGSVVGWDVVNEGIADSGPYLRDTPALRAIGEDYIQKSFEFARAADPDVELYYNDYNIEKDYKFPKALRLLRALKESGTPITGVGIQAHCILGDKKHAAEIDRAIAAFKELGLKVMLTEVDVDVLPRRTSGADVSAREEGADPYKAGLPPEVAAEQGAYYGELFRVVAKHGDAVTRVTLWGTDDGSSWLNNWPVRGRTNHGLIWHRDLSPKPAVAEIVKALQGTKRD